jgi:hypothetical protein
VNLQLLRNDHLCLLYTGLNLEAFNTLVENLTKEYVNSSQLSPRDQLLMNLMKLRLNLLQGDLAERFGTSQSIESKVTSCWLVFMEENMRCYVPWLPRETIQATMPQCFQEHYPKVTCIIDCSETPPSEATQPRLKGRVIQSQLRPEHHQILGGSCTMWAHHVHFVRIRRKMQW